MLEVKNVTKQFGKGENTLLALDNVSVVIPSGTSAAIIGKSGSGKSTLMHIMSGLDHPTSGEVTFNDSVLTKMTAKAADKFRANEMSFIFQSFFVEGNRTCLDNVMLPLEIAKFPRGRREKKALDALEAVELLDKKDEKAKNLSGGQKQRLAIARAIVNDPKLLFADEPTGNLDSHTGDTIESLLFSINKKLKSTLIIVTHDEDLSSKCDMKIQLVDGKIVTGKAKRLKKSKVKKA
jgi:putative ABC transport system ATP-binding protein